MLSVKPSQLPDIGDRVCAVDTETSGLYVDDGARVAVVSVAWFDDNDQVISLAWPFDQGIRDKRPQETLPFEDLNLPEAEWVALLDWLGARRWVCQNAKFDVQMMLAGTRHWPGLNYLDRVVWDTMIASKELDPTLPTGLKPTSERLALTDGGERESEKRVKEAIKKGKLKIDGNPRYDMVDWSIIEPYAALDAELTLRLMVLQQERFEHGEGRMAWFQREMEVMRLLTKIEWRGVGFDVQACMTAAGELLAEQERLAKLLPFPPSVNAAKAYYFGDGEGQLGLVPYEVTDAGSPQLNGSVLRKLVRDGAPNAEIYQQWRAIDVALSMWYQGYPAQIGQDGRLRTCFRQTKEEGEGGGGTVSGRFSVERVNLQAIPHKSRLEHLPAGTPTPREFFQPKEGHGLWELDLQQAELRAAAKIANCDRMLELILQDADLHSVTAKELFRTSEDDPDWFKYRQISKRGNFSLIFGSGPDTFRTMLFKESGIEMGRGEAQDFIDRWRRLYPEYGGAISRFSRIADFRGRVPLVNGKYRYFYPTEYTHKAFNQVVQGSLAEFAKEWALRTEQEYPGALILLIHDSELLELEHGREDEVLPAVAKIGADVGTEWFKVPMGVDYGAWGEH
jgi:DNA polymerase I-like protein with 3'-5' exonuclease and polymerase domains